MPEEGRVLTERVTVDRWLVAATLALVAIGTVMVFTASAPLATESFGRADFFLRRQLIRVVAGLLGMCLVARLDYAQLRRWPAVLGLVISIVLLCLPLAGGLGVSGGVARGASRSVRTGLATFQPAEIARLALVVYLADALSRKRALLASYARGFLPPVMIVGLMAILVLKQPSMGGAVAISLLGLVLLFLSGARLRHILLTALPMVPIAVWEIVREPYRLKRLLGFLHPELDPAGVGWQVLQAKLALAAGGLSGIGLGHSRERVLYLPDAHTDFILAIVGEELGFLGICLIMVLFLFFIARGLWIAARAPDLFGFLLAGGITASVGINWFINVGVVARALPVTGLPLPFVSFGGSSLFVHLMGVGLLLSVSRSRRLRRGDWLPWEGRHAGA